MLRFLKQVFWIKSAYYIRYPHKVKQRRSNIKLLLLKCYKQKFILCKVPWKTPVAESPYLGRMQENTNQKDSEYGHFSRSVFCEKCPATLFQKRLWRSCFPVNFVKFLRTQFLQNTSGELLLIIIILGEFIVYQ